MATYTKKLKTIEVHTMSGLTTTLADTSEDNVATRALNEFEAYDTMHSEEKYGVLVTTLGIPYHAITYIKVSETTASVDDADPYGCTSDEDANIEGES